MNLGDAKKLIRNSINVLRRSKNNALVVVTKELEGTMKKRIFERGQSVGGGKIGKYSRKPMYVSKEGAKSQYGSQIRQGGIRPRGKNSKRSKFKNGNPRRSAYFAGGYAEFRKAVGRQSSYVDLSLTGSLMSSIQTGTRQNRVVLGFVSDRKFRLAEYHEEKYGKSIFSPSRTEEKVTRTNFLKEIVRNLDKAVK